MLVSVHPAHLQSRKAKRKAKRASDDLEKIADEYGLDAVKAIVMDLVKTLGERQAKQDKQGEAK